MLVTGFELDEGRAIPHVLQHFERSMLGDLHTHRHTILSTHKTSVFVCKNSKTQIKFRYYMKIVNIIPTINPDTVCPLFIYYLIITA